MMLGQKLAKVSLEPHPYDLDMLQLGPVHYTHLHKIKMLGHTEPTRNNKMQFIYIMSVLPLMGV